MSQLPPRSSDSSYTGPSGTGGATAHRDQATAWITDAIHRPGVSWVAIVGALGERIQLASAISAPPELIDAFYEKAINALVKERAEFNEHRDDA